MLENAETKKHKSQERVSQQKWGIQVKIHAQGRMTGSELKRTGRLKLPNPLHISVSNSFHQIGSASIKM